MIEEKLTQTYHPNPVLRVLYRRFFDNIQVDKSWVAHVKSLASEGNVVYMLRNLNFIDFLALDHLTKRYHLPKIRFVNDLGLGLLNPMGKGWRNAILNRPKISPEVELQDALSKGDSAAIFLRRPPSMREMVSGSRAGMTKEGDSLLITLLELQKLHSTPILLLPQVFVWTKRPDTNGTIWYDFLLGPREWPSPTRTIFQFLYNYKYVELKAGKPFDLSDFINGKQHTSSIEADVQIITYTILERLARERRSVTGPAYRPPDLLRQQVLFSPSLQRTILKLSRQKLEKRYELTQRAQKYLQHIQAIPNITTIKFLAAILDKLFHRIYAGIDIDKEGLEQIRECCKDSTVILLPSHKSHIDYLVLSYLFFINNIQLPLITAGDNLSFFPLGFILRGGGAFFIRRTFRGDPLYVGVIGAYVRRIVREGYAIELFIEGSRSRTGKLLTPKFGILKTIITAALSRPHQKVYFAPVSIGYERIVETEAYENEMVGKDKVREDTTGLIKSTQILRYRYGRINVQFGQVLNLDDIRKELGFAPYRKPTPSQTRAIITRLGNRVMDEINRVTAVTPGNLVALALLSDHQKDISHQNLLIRCRKLLKTLESVNARITSNTAYDDSRLRSDTIHEAIQMYIDGELLHTYSATKASKGVRIARRSRQAGRGMTYRVPSKMRLQLDTTKNIIIHFFVERSLISIAILTDPGPPISRQSVRDRVFWLSQLFKYEFRFHADTSFDEIFSGTLDAMQKANEVTIDSNQMISPGSGDDDWSGQIWLLTYAWIMQSVLEGYQIATRGLSFLSEGDLNKKELIKKILSMGNSMYNHGEIELRESVNKLIIENALLSFVDFGYLMASNSKYQLSNSYNSSKALEHIERKISRTVKRDSSLSKR